MCERLTADEITGACDTIEARGGFGDWKPKTKPTEAPVDTFTLANIAGGDERRFRLRPATDQRDRAKGEHELSFAALKWRRRVATGDGACQIEGPAAEEARRLFREYDRLADAAGDPADLGF